MLHFYIYLSVSLCPQVTIVIKYFFQFGFFPFNQKLEVDRAKPFHPPNILGVEKKEGYVLYDLLQLLALFYHRAILKVENTKLYHQALLEVKKHKVLHDLFHLPRSPLQCHGLWDQTVTMETDVLHHHDDQADSTHDATTIDSADAINTLRRRGRRRTRSSSTQLRSPAGRI